MENYIEGIFIANIKAPLIVARFRPPLLVLLE